jgi:hypothetical protein
MEQGRDRIALDLPWRHEPVRRFAIACRFVVDHSGKGFGAANAKYFQAGQGRADRLHFRPDVGIDRRIGRDQRLRARLLHDAGDLRRLEEVVHRIGDGRDLRTPQGEERLRHARHQQGHRVLRTDAVAVQDVAGLGDTPQDFVECHVAYRIAGGGARQVTDGDLAGVVTGRLAEQVGHPGVTDAIGHRHALECGDIGHRADAHVRILIGIPCHLLVVPGADMTRNIDLCQDGVRSG